MCYRPGDMYGMAKPLFGQLALVGAALAAAVVATQVVQPVFVGRAPVVQ